MSATLIKLSLSALFPALVLGWLGFALLRRRPRWGKRILWLGLLTLTVLSMPLPNRMAMAWLEAHAGPPLALESLPRATSPSAIADAPQAIVILGAGVAIAPEYGKHSLGAVSLQRLRYGALLARHTGLPMLVSGGNPDNYLPKPEAWYMQKVLSEEFVLPARWVEDRSANTRENAGLSVPMLKAEQVSRIYLVTTASHMWRAQRCFEQAGIAVVPAPTAFAGRPFSWSWVGFVPNPASLVQLHEVLHELVGLAVYRLRESA